MLCRVLSLDLASRTGWCVADAERIVSGRVDFTPRGKLDPATKHALIFDRASSWLSDMIDTYRPTVCALEDSTGRTLQGQAARVLLGLRAVALVVLHRREVLVDPVANTTWKAWATRRGWRLCDKSDEQDARWLALYWQAERAGLVREAA